MKDAINTVELVGKVAREPEINYTPDGNPVAHFTLAVPNPRNREAPSLVDISATDSLSDVVLSVLQKRTHVYVHGRLIVTPYLEAGLRRKLVEIEIDTLTLLRDDGSEGARYVRTGNVNERLRPSEPLRGSFLKNRAFPQRAS